MWEVNSFDTGILLFLNQFARRSFTWDALLSTVEGMNVLKGGALMGFLLYIWFRGGENKTRDREFVIFSFIISAAALVTSRALALTLPFRERPLRAQALHFQLPYGMNPHALQNWSSFPSDHAAISFAIATCLLFISRRLGIGALVYSFFAICFPRVYLGIHYPTDIVAGALIGVTMAFWIKLSPLRTALARPFLRWEDLHPGLFYPLFFLVGFEVSEMFGSLRAIGKFCFLVAKTAAGQQLR
jgi:undecaprenyl-diphosphatase